MCVCVLILSNQIYSCLFICLRMWGGVLIKVSRSVWFHFRSVFNPVEGIGKDCTSPGCGVAHLDAVGCKIYFIGSKLMPIQKIHSTKNKQSNSVFEISKKLLTVLVRALIMEILSKSQT